MRITIDRFIFNDRYTIGKLYIEEEFFYYTLELPWHDNKQSISCIPIGEYQCQPYSSKKYDNVVELQQVPNRSKILIHAGNYPENTNGCILVGDSYDEGAVWNSKNTLQELFSRVEYNFQLRIKGGKKMPLIASIVAKRIASPIFAKLAKPLKEKVINKFKDVLITKFGIKTKEDVDNIKPEMMASLRGELEDISLGIEKEITKQTDTVHKTMQAELKATNIMQKTWRPFVGYCFGASAVLLIFTVCLVLVIAVFKGGETITNFASIFSSISGLVTIIFGALGGVCGAIGYGRSQEKIKGAS